MNNNEIKILVFKVNEEYYAADIMEVERILAYEETTKIPESPYFVDGVRNYEGGILPVIVLAKKFNLPFEKIQEDAKVIVIKSGELKLGIVVDEVSEVINIKENIIEKEPEVINGISKKYIRGLIKLSGKIIIFLDMKFILNEDEKQMLDM